MAIVLVFVLAACTTQKSRNDQSTLSKLYHNTTAHYNGYFNAEELMKASILQLEEQHEDNYTKILELYPYAAADNPQAVAPDLDKAIEKVSIVVNLHRQSNWTDDCYLLVGKAQYLKQDYESAEKTLRYLVNEFNPEKLARDKKLSQSKTSGKDSKASKKRKKKRAKKQKSKESKAKERARKQYNKEVRKARKKGTKAPPKPAILQRGGEETAPAVTEAEEDKKKKKKEAEAAENNPDSYFLKHRPVYQEGVLWLAHVLIDRDKYEQSMRYIRQLDQDPGTFDDVRADLMGVEAYYYLSQKDYEKALVPLERAIEMADKRDKARYAYIVAQIHQRAGRGEQAYAAFEEVLRYGPEYEMEFSARLNMAQSAWASGRGTAADARDRLEKMLKDAKNIEYQDQIYFALASIALKENDREEAIRNLELSLKYNRRNRAQKAESYLTLADLYFEEENFVNAKLYYDSTMQVLANTDERYDRVRRVNDNLTEIAENLQLIELQDSLLRISRMSDEEKLELASQIKREQDQARLNALKEKQTGTALGPQGGAGRFTAPGRLPTPGTAALQQESSFFAYDERQVRRAMRDFERTWGDRKLEDDWRRSNRRNAGDFELEEEIVDQGDVIALTDEEVLKLLGDVPTTEQEIAAANLAIQEAMFKLGSLYRERLENNEKAVEILEELDRRYPGNTFELDAWYLLYLTYTDLNQPAKAREYADKIIGKYPTTTYAKVLQDPNYVELLASEEKKLNNYYDDAFAAFSSGRYQEAYQKSVSAKEKFGAANAYQPKFALLSAMCKGNLEGKEAYVAALTEVVAKYPDTPEQKRAREILRLLGGATAALPGQALEEETGNYKVEDEQLHYIIVAFEKGTNLNDQKTAISDYNLKYHKLDKLRISNIYLGTDPNTSMPIVVVRRFKNKDEAMNYFNGVQKNAADFIDASGVSYQIYAISQNNYREILREKSLTGYDAFFQANYLK